MDQNFYVKEGANRTKHVSRVKSKTNRKTKKNYNNYGWINIDEWGYR